MAAPRLSVVPVVSVCGKRRGFQGLAAKLQTALLGNSRSGHAFVFRGHRDDTILPLA
jgi:transposase